MAGVVVEQVWRDAEPEAIEPELAELWREVGSRSPASRAVMSNLVIVRGCDSDEAFAAHSFLQNLPLDEVVARHPSRVIVVAHEHGCRVARPPIAARVGITTYGPPQARYRIERIAVRSACDEASIASIVRRLVRGDVPTTVWWADDISRTPPLRSIVAEARQLVYDSRSWTAVADAVRVLRDFVAEGRLDLADVNWRRLQPVRQALLHAGDELSPADLRPDRVRIDHRPGEAALAWLLAGWMARRLGWPDRAVPRIEQSRDASVVLALEVGLAPAVSTVVLTDDRAVVRQHGWPAYTVGVRRESDAEAIAAELRTLARDAGLRDAVRELARRLTSAATP